MSSSPANITYLPLRDCHEISLQCPLEHSIYGYVPSLGGNAFFTAVFAACLLPQVYFGIRYKTWSYLLAMSLACVDQALGYAGRIMLYNNVWNRTGFQIQICCLILGPAFNSAAIYLVLKHITLTFGPEFSKLKPNWYTWIFIAGDLLSLVIQAFGGALAATANEDVDRQRLGDRLMLAGIAFQVVTLFFFGTAASWYILRRRRAKHVPLTREAQKFMSDTKFRLFALGFTAAYFAILVRCIYRIAEMAGGWRNEIMQNEAAFIVLDGCMVAIATIIQTVFHPGYCFPRLSSAYVVPSEDALDTTTHTGVHTPEGEETVEKSPRGST